MKRAAGNQSLGRGGENLCVDGCVETNPGPKGGRKGTAAAPTDQAIKREENKSKKKEEKKMKKKRGKEAREREEKKRRKENKMKERKRCREEFFADEAIQSDDGDTSGNECDENHGENDYDYNCTWIVKDGEQTRCTGARAMRV